ncbi:MAG: hypothetical protein JXB50_12095 [Spirochaetes bacterium]|nr:hypothetical protein [Spirochaetota bacterium]
MALQKPLKRTVRLLTNGTYANGGHWQYLLHPKFANDPQHYIRAYLIIQEDLQKLFEFVEPCDKNLNTISLKIQELLIRVCIEIEANFTAILKENIYSNSGNMNIQNDYSLIEISHRLSSYKVKFPIWKGKVNIRRPFENWASKPSKNWHVLKWYQEYNKSKHDRHLHFDKATFNNLLDAVCGLVIILSAQFMDENYSPNLKNIGSSGNYSYDYDPKMETAIGDYFRIQFPDDWKEEEKYGFNWENICSLEEPIDKIDYNKIKIMIYKTNLK